MVLHTISYFCFPQQSHKVHWVCFPLSSLDWTGSSLRCSDIRGVDVSCGLSVWNLLAQLAGFEETLHVVSSLCQSLSYLHCQQSFPLSLTYETLLHTIWQCALYWYPLWLTLYAVHKYHSSIHYSNGWHLHLQKPTHAYRAESSKATFGSYKSPSVAGTSISAPKLTSISVGSQGSWCARQMSRAFRSTLYIKQIDCLIQLYVGRCV